MISIQDFKDELSLLTADDFFSKNISERVPALFDEDWVQYRGWIKKAASLLDVDRKNIAVVGSAACGFSLNPNKNFKIFDSGSDIDLAVISTFHFDLAWRKLRRMKRSEAKNNREANALDDHRKRLVYWGCIATDKILRFLPFAEEWASASIVMSGTDPSNGRSVNFRLYRDYESLRLYQLNSINGAKSL